MAAPKVYGFDTGFVSYYRGWQEVRQEDLGLLWEHFVLNEIQARMQNREVLYWRDKHGHEVDFVLPAPRKQPLAIECKWSANNFDPANLAAFRRQHPDGENIVLAHDVHRAFRHSYANLRVRFEPLETFVRSLQAA